MKIWDALKDLGVTDEQLKDFFKAQRRYKYKLDDIKQHKHELGIEKYTPHYTPTSLFNMSVERSSFGEVNLKKTMEDILKSQETEKQSLTHPVEVEEALRETIRLANTFRFFPTNNNKINEIMERYRGNYKQLLDDLEEIQDTFYRYQDAPDDAYQYYPALQEALSIFSTIVFG